MNENDIAQIVFEKGMKIHKQLGPGLLESVYEECLYLELVEHGLKVQKQVEFPITYKNHVINSGFRADLVVENKFLVELKSVTKLNDLHLAQTLTYLKMTNLKLAFLINFNEPLFKSGVRRVIHGRI